MNLVKILQLYHCINDYFLLKYSSFDNTKNKIVLERDYVIDLMKFNRIIGKMEIYVNEKKDKENGIYMVEWFKKEMYDTNLDYDDFMEWAEEFLKTSK